MKTPRTRISSLIADQTLHGGVSKKLARELAAYLLNEHRTRELDSILRDVQADWAAAGYVEVVAASATPLTASVKKDIKAVAKRLYPHAKRISLSEERDPDLIGGVRLSLANQQLDLSIESRLNKFKQFVLSGKQ